MPELAIDRKQENNESTSLAGKDSAQATQNSNSKNLTPEQEAQQAKEKHLQQLHENRFHKKGARIAFHLVNFGGLHQVFNNVASVVITFVLSTTKGADWMKERMADTIVGKRISDVLSVPGRVVNGGFKLAGVELNKGLNALSEAEKAAELTYRVKKSRRSAIETLFMCIAGFIALAPVHYLENHREGFLNKVDNWLHPNRTPEEKEAAALKPGDEPKETWWNLIKARFVALAVVFSIDQVRDNVDSILRYNHKNQNKPGMYKNIDSVAGWGLGDKIYTSKWMPEKARSFIAKFLSGNKIKLSAIQHEIREDILKIIDAPAHVRHESDKIAKLHEQIRRHPENKELEHKLLGEIEHIEAALKKDSKAFSYVERAVFAEQSRLFVTKEFALTTILSIVIYGCTKWKPAHNLLSKVGFTKKPKKQECQDELALNEVSVVPAVAVIEDSIIGSPEPRHASGKRCAPEKNNGNYTHKLTSKKTSRPMAADSFTDKILQTQDQQGLQLGT